MNKAVFLDRDGVINKKLENTYVEHWSEFIFLPKVAEAVKLLNQNGFLVIVITNQRGIARKFMTVDMLMEIHERMQIELQKEVAIIDKIYFCPHNDIDNCNCRKPKPGMLLQAAADFELDLTKSFMIGDSDSDMIAGAAAGCRTIFIKNNVDKNFPNLLYGKIEQSKEIVPDFVCFNLLEAVDWILKKQD